MPGELPSRGALRLTRESRRLEDTLLHAAGTRMGRSESSGVFDVRLFFFFGWELGFDVHIAKFARLKDLAALQALYVLRIFVARNDLDSGMPTRVVHCVALRIVEGCFCWLAQVHRIRLRVQNTSIVGYFSPELSVVKHFSC